MDVFRVRHECGSTEGFEGASSVHGVRSDADCAILSVSVRLNEPVEQFLNPRSTFSDAVLLILGDEELWSLNDCDSRIIKHVGERLMDEIISWAEIRIEDDEEFSLRLTKGVPEIPRLLHLIRRSRNVVEAELIGENPESLVLLVVEDVNLTVVPAEAIQRADVLPGILDDLVGLSADGEEDVDRNGFLEERVLIEEPGMFEEGEVLPRDADHEGDAEIKDERSEEERVEEQTGIRI